MVVVGSIWGCLTDRLSQYVFLKSTKRPAEKLGDFVLFTRPPAI